MTFLGWIEYPSMMYAIHKNEQGFLCVKYVNGNKIEGAQFSFENPDKLQVFLLALPNANTEEIEKFLSTL